MYEEIKQDNKTILSSEDGVSIPVIFNLLNRSNTPNYETYIQCVAIKDMGFHYGEIKYYQDGELIKTGTIKHR